MQTILNHVLENATLTPKTEKQVDANTDGTIDVGDIQKFYYDSVS